MVKTEGKAVLANRTKPALLAEWPLRGTVNAAALAPDGKSLAIAVGSVIQIIDSSTGRELLNPMVGHMNGITSIDFSPDSAHIVSGSTDETVRLWDAQGGREIITAPMRHQKGVFSVAFSPKGNFIASGSGDCTVRIWDNQRGQCFRTLEGHTSSVYAVHFSSNGKKIVSGSNDWCIRVWDIETGIQKLGPPTTLNDYPNQAILALPISPDSRTELKRRLWAFENEREQRLEKERKQRLEKERKQRLKDKRSGSQESQEPLWKRAADLVKDANKEHLSNAIYSVEFSPDGAHIVSGCRDGTMRLWDSVTGKQICSLFATGSPSSVTCAKFTPDGTRIISGTADGAVCVWSVKTGRLVLGPLIGHRAKVTWVGSRDGVRMFSVSEDTTIRIWDLQSEQTPLYPVLRKREVTTIGFSHDGTKMVSGGTDSAVCLWDTQNCQLVASRHNIRYASGYNNLARVDKMEIHSISISPGGERIAYAARGLLRLWDWRGYRVIDISTTSKLEYLGFSHNGQLIVIAGPREIRILNRTSGKPEATITRGSGISALACSPVDSPMAIGLEDGLIEVWGIERSPSQFKSLAGHKDRVTSIAFSPGGLLLVSGSRDKTLRVWNIGSGETKISPIHGHISPVNSVKFSPDGDCIASASGDEGIFLWDAQ
ncbi:hypothetical protein FRC11_004151, partial [Ceratobasidium sp. 423]